MTRRVYFDSCTFLAVFLREEDRLEPAGAAIQSSEQGLTIGYLSALTVAECIGAPALRSPQQPSDEDEVRLSAARDFFRRTSMRYVEATQRSGEAAMGYAVDFGLKGPDALHLAMARNAGCDELFTYDAKLLRVGKEIAGLHVRKPYGHVQDEFDFAGR